MAARNDIPARIPEEVLAEQYYRFLHKLISQIQDRFRASGIAQKDIAARLGKKPSFISRTMSGQTNMTVRTLHDLARAMDSRLEITVRPLSEIKPANRFTAWKSNKVISPAASMPLKHDGISGGASAYVST